MALTADEALKLSAALERAALATLTEGKVLHWEKIDLSGAKVTLAWDIGASVEGYVDMRQRITRMVQEQLPELLKKAIREVQTDGHIARACLPKVCKPIIGDEE